MNLTLPSQRSRAPGRVRLSTRTRWGGGGLKDHMNVYSSYEKTILEGKLISVPNPRLSTPCLFWPKTHGTGYGYFYAKVSECEVKLRHKVISAHRHTWVRAYGPIPEGLCVCHKCDNRPCVELSHLFLGTRKDNMDDCAAKGRRNSLFGERISSHKLTCDNVREIRIGGHATKFFADKFGVHRTTILAARSGKLWKHVT